MNQEDREGRIGTFITDCDLIVMFWDKRLMGITGISPEDAMKKPLNLIIPDFEKRKISNYFNEVLKNGVIKVLSPAFHNYLIPCKPLKPSKNFEFMQQKVTIAPVLSGDQIVNIVVTIEDVTGRLDYENQLAEELNSPDEKIRLQAAEKIAQENINSSEELFNSIGDESWRVRKAAVDALARTEDGEVVEKLIHILRDQHKDLSVLNSVLSVLSITNIDTTMPIVWLLNDPDDDLRIYAAQVLGDKFDSRAIPGLINALNDSNQNVCYHAIETLGKLRAESAVEPLVRIIESQDFFLSFPAIDALVRIDDKSVATRLVPFIQDPLLCTPIIEALGKLGDEEAVEPLSLLLNKQGTPVCAIAKALADLYNRYEKMYGEGSHISDLASYNINLTGAQNLIDSLDNANSEELRVLALVLGWLEGKSIEKALTRLLGNPSARREVVEALVRYGSRVTDLLTEQLNSEDIETCRSAIIAIGRIGDTRAVPYLMNVLGRDEELTVVAIGALAKIGDSRSFYALLDLIGHSNISIRQASVGALNSLGHPEMPEHIKELLLDENPLVRESAVKIAGYFGYPDCVDSMLDLAGDGNESVRAAMIEHIPYLESEKALSVLFNAIKYDTPKVKAAGVRALSHVDGKEAFSYLLEALKDEDSWVRYFACRSLGHKGLPDAVDALIEAAGEDNARYVRFAAIDSMGRIGGPKALSVLGKMKESPDEEIARSAINALGKVDHPDALPPLFSALKSRNPELQKDAAQALGEHGGEGVARSLQWAAATENDLSLVNGYIDAISRLKTPEAAEVLIELAVDQKRRELCIESMVNMGSTAVEWVAKGLYYPHTGVRKAIIEVLARMR